LMTTTARMYHHQMYFAILFALIAYICGSFPSAVIVSRIVGGPDPRTVGSGNAGATNTIRSLGFGWGALVFAIDVAKGYLPVLAISLLYQVWVPDVSVDNYGLSMALFKTVTGIGAIVGHVFPLFSHFKGGKGVATAAGVLLALFPSSLVVCVIAFAVALFTTGYVSVASMSAAGILPVAYIFLERGWPPFSTGLFIRNSEYLYLPIVIVLPLLVVFLHRKNIVRLMSGTEARFEKVRVFKK